MSKVSEELHNLKEVYYNGTMSDWCNITFSSSDANPMYYAQRFYMLDENNEYYEVTEIEITDTITSIGECQFYGFKNVTNVIIPNSVTSIGDSAFYNCTSLTNVIFEEGSKLTTIQNVAFYNCTSLTNITIPSGVTSIGSYAFYNSINLKEITLPESLLEIGEGAFSECKSLKRITIPKQKMFRTFSVYTEFQLWFIPTDVEVPVDATETIPSVVPQLSAGLRVNVF